MTGDDSHLIVGQSMLSLWNVYFFSSDGPFPEKRSKELLSETKP